MINKLAFSKPTNISIFFLYGLIITAMSLKPDVQVESIPYNDKVAHLLAYTIFTFLAWRIESKPTIFAKWCIGLILYGVFIEVAQHYTGRMMSFYDVVANTTGTILTMIILYYIDQYQRTKMN